MSAVLKSYLSLCRTNLRMAESCRHIRRKDLYDHHMEEAKFWLESYWYAKPRT